MVSKSSHQTHATGQVKSLIDKIYGRSVLKDSVLERAISYFESLTLIDKVTTDFQNSIDELNAKLAGSSGKNSEKITLKLAKIEKEQDAYALQLRVERIERHSHLLGICQEIIELTEGENFEETSRKSAQVLGTIQLLIPAEGKLVVKTNEQSKPLYKAILCLRLLDQILIDKVITDAYISPFLEGFTQEQLRNFAEIDQDAFECFVQQVKVPVLMAAIIQDIGHFHPDAQAILLGEDGSESPYRTLEIESRKSLLQINYRETVKYLVNGIGSTGYVGNSKQERDSFNKNEHQKLIFIKQLIKSSINPKNSIGNLLKIPQIYTSIVLSTKENYNYKLLPKVFQVLNQNAEKGSCAKSVVDCLYKITGMFPQGYGITYIPLDSDGKSLDRYEYAIVNQLYPENPQEPICRIATRHLTFISFGQDHLVKRDSNLYFTETAKKLATVSKARLKEILELLVSNYQERAELDLLPRCWHVKEFFSIKDHQKLWNKTNK